MIVVKQEGYLLWMDEVDDGVKKGAVMESDMTGEHVVVVYVDREENLLGVIPKDAL